jgi:hypothetical protein
MVPDRRKQTRGRRGTPPPCRPPPGGKECEQVDPRKCAGRGKGSLRSAVARAIPGPGSGRQCTRRAAIPPPGSSIGPACRRWQLPRNENARGWGASASVSGSTLSVRSVGRYSSGSSPCPREPGAEGDCLILGRDRRPACRKQSGFRVGIFRQRTRTAQVVALSVAQAQKLRDWTLLRPSIPLRLLADAIQAAVRPQQQP